MKHPAWLVAFFITFLCVHACAENSISSQIQCVESEENTQLVFKNESGQTSRVTFMDSHEELMLKSNTIYGLLKWKDIVVIHAIPLKDNGSLHQLNIEYMSDKDVRKFEAGAVTENCLIHLQERYSRLKFNSEP